MLILIGIVSTIIDDISMASNFENVVEALQHIDVNGKKSGYKINFEKTQYVMCKVTNKEELLRKLHILKEIGLKDEKIKVHPDSVSLLDNPTDAEIEEEKAERTVKYGGKLLGA